MNPIKLLIADDHTILRQGLIGILEEYPDLCIVAEAENGQNMISKYFTFHPDVVLSDIEMPEVNGLEAAQAILEKDSSAKILFLSMHDSEETIYQLLQLNAYGLVPKEVIKNELVLAIRTVAKGEKYFQGRNKEDLEKIREKYSSRYEANHQDVDLILTYTEKKILLLIADGKTSHEIANITDKSKRTVDTMRASIMSKLNLHSLPKLIKFAIDYSVTAKQKKE